MTILIKLEGTMRSIVNVRHFDETHSFNVLAGATQVIYTFVVPPKCILRVLKFANYTDTPAAVGTGLTWHINRNGIGVHRYDNILDIIGQSYQPEEIDMPEFKGSDVLTVVTVNGTGGAVLSGARIIFDLEDVR